MSALALALIYGLGGCLAVRGDLEAGTVVTMALLLGQLYAPLTALASARVDAMAALVSFERVFEVLDLEPLIDRAGRRRRRCRPVRSRVELDDVTFAYPSADKVSLASLEEVATLDTRGGDERAARRLVHGRAGPGGGAGRLVGQRQVDDRLAGPAALRRRRRQRSGSAASTCAT